MPLLVWLLKGDVDEFFNEIFGAVLDFSGDPDPDYDADTGIFKGILSLWNGGNFTNFADNQSCCRRLLL